MKQLTDSLTQLENTLELYFGKKAPAMPQNIKETLVNIGPWLIMLMLILLVPGLLAAFGVGAILGPLSMYYGATTGFSFGIFWVLTVVMLFLGLKALPGLFKRSIGSWRLLFYASLVGLVQNLVMFNIFNLVVGGALGMYILFQIKSLYK